MTWLAGPLMVVLAVLAGSPWLLAHRAERRLRRRFVKMRRKRLRAR